MTSVYEAIALIDAVIGAPTTEQVVSEKKRREASRLTSLGFAPREMKGVATKGCRKCGKTMYRTREHSGASQWVCSSCGAVE